MRLLLPIIKAVPINIRIAFLTIFKVSHPGHLASVSMQFRLHLLRFTTLLMHRLTKRPSTPPLSTLESIRCQNRERATLWLSHNDQSSIFPAKIKPMLPAYDAELPLLGATLSRNREHVSSALKAESDPLSFYGLPSCPSLLDTLSEFMALSAAQTAMIRSSTITTAWMSLAARYMTQSVLEQYLIYGGKGTEPLLEAFAWGFNAGLVADARSVEGRTNAMFWDEDGEVVGWEDLRNRHIRAVSEDLPSSPRHCWRHAQFIPEPGESLDIHLENLAVRNPISEFEDGMIAFLKALLVCQPKPILAQMESAKLNGLSRLENDLLKQRVGFTGWRIRRSYQILSTPYGCSTL